MIVIKNPYVLKIAITILMILGCLSMIFLLYDNYKSSVEQDKSIIRFIILIFSGLATILIFAIATLILITEI